MEHKFLLYIDTLGFSKMVREDVSRVRYLYDIVENLTVYDHHEFKIIVFSDTFLIYNIEEPINDDERQDMVRFSIEFFRNLFYKCVGKNYYFRAVLVHGEFEHIPPVLGYRLEEGDVHLHSEFGDKPSTKVDRFYGKALVDAYESERQINCTGLFIDRYCQKYNEYFPVEQYDDKLSYVYVNRSLEEFYMGGLGDWPVDPVLMEHHFDSWHLAMDIHFLKDVNRLMRCHKDPRVEEKHQTTWDYYCRRYERLMCDLESKGFDLSVLSKDFNWKPAKARIFYGYQGFGVNPPSEIEFNNIIQEAREAGCSAAKEEFKKIYPESEPGEDFFAPCGGGHIILDVDGRNQLGKFLERVKSKVEGISVYSYYGCGYTIDIRGMHNRQERTIDVAASKAALDILQARLNVRGFVEGYYS